MSEVERRSVKLHKQSEIEADDDDLPGSDRTSGGGHDPRASTRSLAGVPTPTVLSASSSSETSPDDGQAAGVMPVSKPTITRKQTLTRAQALEGTSPPPESFSGQVRPNGQASESGHLTNGGMMAGQDKPSKVKGAAQQEAKEFLLSSHAVSNDSGRGTLDINDGCPESPPVLSRDSSMENNGVEYKDSSGVNLVQFFKTTLNKSAKDRKFLLSLEKEFYSFITNTMQHTQKLMEMNPYDRMVAHRMAAYHGLEHNVDQSGKCIVLTKTNRTRMPGKKIADLFEHSEDSGGPPKRKILLKKPASLDEKQSWNSSKAQFGSNRAKSLEERQQNYTEVRERIFKNEENPNYGADGMAAPHQLCTPHFIPQQRSLDSLRPNIQHTKVLGGSIDSSSYGLEMDHQRLAITKSNSYSGPMAPMTSHGCQLYYLQQQQPQPPFGHTRAANNSFSDPVNPNYENCPPRPPTQDHMTPTGSISDQSQMSQSSSDAGQSPLTQTQHCPTSFAYLVSSDYSSIPVGSVIINPHTMEPHMNTDGTYYRFDPACPPPFMLQPSASTQPIAQPPQAGIVYTNDPMGDLTARFASSSISPVEGVPLPGAEQVSMGVPGQPLSLVSPHSSQHPCSASSTPHPAHLTQNYYYTSPPSIAQTVRLVPYPMHQGQPPQQIYQGAGLESQSPVTMPISGVNMSPFPSTTVQVIPSYPPTHSAQYVDLGTSISYGPGQESGLAPNAGGLSTSVMAPRHSVVQPYGLTSYAQHQTTQVSPHGQPSSFNTSCSVPPGTTFYSPGVATATLPNPNPPSPMSHPPPLSHPHHLQQQQQQQHPPPQTVYFSPNVTSVPVSPLTFPISPSSNPPPIKSVPTPTVLQTQYRPATPPQPTQHQQQQQQHQQQQQQQQQQHLSHQAQPQTPVNPPTNGLAQPSQLTLTYSQQPVAFAPNQTLAAHPQGSSFVTFPTNQYPAVRPVGTVGTLIPVAAGQALAQPNPGAHIPSYQIFRPAGTVQELGGVVAPNALAQRMPHILCPGSGGQQPRFKGSNTHKVPRKGSKKSGDRETEEVNQGLSSQVSIRMPMGAHVIQPLTHLPTAPSKRQ